MKTTYARRRFYRGFTLTETVIVLGVMGLVVAAIWTTASVVRQRQPVLDTVQLVTDIATNVRGVYTGHPNAVPPLTPDAQVDAGLFPASVVNETQDDTINSWGGTLFLRFNNPIGTGFSVEVDIPATIDVTERRAACLGLMTSLPAVATNYAGGFNNTLPTSAVEIDPVQGNAPSLAFVRDGAAWEDATKKSVAQITTDTTSCTGVAFYFRL
ncbi:MAG TPA: hypothetical protein DCY07_06815 [Rhodospirillaceae bacterium]|nr:hypothetical protein [Rhodospirillaceae bacterium]